MHGNSNIKKIQERVYEHNTVSLSRNQCYSRKAVSITYSEWVSIAFVINHAMRMPRILSVARLVVPIFF
jgi:hypothetical protein